MAEPKSVHRAPYARRGPDPATAPLGHRGAGLPAPASSIGGITRADGSTPSPVGLPAAVRVGVESLSGLDMGGVRVHPDSPWPKEIGALAFAQGNDIHLAPGQQRHLPHEAWHVVQQMQGRVHAGLQARGLPLADDAGLEREADTFGALAVSLGRSHAPSLLRRASVGSGPTPIQRVKETEFKANPEAFLGANLLTLDFQRGLAARVPDLGKGNDDFLKKMAGFGQHWFQLVVDAGRSKPDKPAYLLVPAVEKYVAAFGGIEGNAWLAELARLPVMPPVAAPGQYIEAAYIQYLTKKVVDADTDVGHASITKSAVTEGFNPDFVFTDVMNGCAFTVTEGADDAHFDAWHFQSPGSNKAKASEFRRERDPLDWFGEEEYDSGSHPGLYETTNLMWRQDDAWKVVSQVNDFAIDDRNKLSGSKVKSRALNVEADGRDRLAMLKRIYVRIGQNQHYEADRQYVNALKPELDRTRQAALHGLFTKAMLQIQGDIDGIDGAGSIPVLHAKAAQRRLARGVQKALLDPDIDTQVNALEQIYQTEIAKWGFRRDQAQEQKLNIAINNVTGLKGVFGNVAWLQQLEDETAPED